MSTENAKPKIKLTLAQRTAANKQLENDLIAAGLSAESWTVATGAKPGTGVNVFDKTGKQICRITVNEAGFVKMRDVLRGADVEALELVADATGAQKDKYTEEVKRYGAQKFDLSRLA